MHCLLCHEKIPRLRAWTGKSEFCCDEHAELYKKQTLDRLLIDDAQSKSPAPALPIVDGGTLSVDHILLKRSPNKSKRANDDQATDEIDELWKLAERMGPKEETAPSTLLPGISSETHGDVQAQSAEEALAALQALAAGGGQGSGTGVDLLDEFSRMESSFEELSQLESLPAEMGHDEIDEAPELEFDSLESHQAQEAVRPELVAPESIEVPDLQLEGLEEAQLEPPEFAADFESEQAVSLGVSEPALEELRAASEVSDSLGSDLSDPPEPAAFDIASSGQAQTGRPMVGRAPQRPPMPAPKLRPAMELQEMRPSPNLPQGGYALKPWTDALTVAGPERSSLLIPIKFVELRKSSLNGTASGKFDPVLFRASERVAAVAVPIAEPTKASVPLASQDEALKPCTDLAWPAPLHAALIAGEMKLKGKLEGISLRESFFSVKQPTLSGEFLSSVALQSRILEPRRSAILSPRERDGFAAAAEEEGSGSESASAAGRLDRNEKDGGERAHVADLF